MKANCSSIINIPNYSISPDETTYVGLLTLIRSMHDLLIDNMPPFFSQYAHSRPGLSILFSHIRTQPPFAESPTDLLADPLTFYCTRSKGGLAP